MFLTLIFLNALMLTIEVDHKEFVGERDRVSVSIKRSSTLDARDELISDDIMRASSLGLGKDEVGVVVGSFMRYRSFDLKAGGYLTIYYSDSKNESSFMTCHIRSESTRYSAFGQAMRWCANRLNLAVPPMVNLPISDDRGLLPDELKKPR